MENQSNLKEVHPFWSLLSAYNERISLHIFPLSLKAFSSLEYSFDSIHHFQLLLSMTLSYPPTSTSRVWLVVLKVSPLAGPRRRTDRHSVLVKALPRQPGHQLDHWVKTSRRAKRLRVVDALYDLMPRPSDPGGRDAPFIRPKENELIKTTASTLRQQLLCDGYTVNGCLTVWHLYTIELKPFRRVQNKPVHGYVYVGQTSLNVQDRIRQHREGHHTPSGHRLHSATCHKFFKRPRLDLMPQDFHQTFYCQEDALTAEADLRIYFESAGYLVEGGTERLTQRKQALGIT